MALDEALLEQAATIGQPVLRFYSWTEPAATFGYFQKYSEVEQLTKLRPLVRRPTGGGIVSHDADWTYSLIFPPKDPWYALKAVESYQRVHLWIQAAFAAAGLLTQLAPEARKEAPGQCFAGAERHDVLCKDRKIAGAAQRRSRQGLLIQGSIQPPRGIGREQWLEAFCRVATNQWNALWEPLELTSELQQHARQLATEKYGLASYNRRK